MNNILWQGKEVLSVIEGHGEHNWSASGVSIDTRTIKKGDIFFALPGLNHDGNEFIEEALDRGASIAISNKPSLINSKKVVFVNDVLKSLTRLGSYSRVRTKAKIISVTGSSGKTTLKEMIAYCLTEFGKVHKSKKSYNNNIGVPLSLSNMPMDVDYGIFEIGMNRKGEISNLANILKPHIGIVNNAGKAHIGFFNNEKEIIKEKLSIVDGIVDGGNLIVNDKLLSDLKDYPTKDKSINTYSFGFSKKADAQLTESIFHNSTSFLISKINNKEIKYLTNLIGEHMALNTLPAILVNKIVNNSNKKFFRKLERFKAIEGRGNRFHINFFNKNIKIIDESYNANPDSMEASINTIKINKDNNKRVIFFVGDMLELGKHSKAMHKRIAKLVNNSEINLVFAIGSEVKYLWEDINYEKKGEIFNNVNEVIPKLRNIILDKDIILLKGSSKINLNKIIDSFLSHKALRKIA
tara:strand:- start:4032 stop:5429 length:1398 start_codon:yes stop_codon:yes gene_type:complete